MNLSRKPKVLLEQVLDLVRICSASRGQRSTFQNELMDYYLKGSSGVQVARANKIKPVIKRQASFLYAPENLKFWVDPSPAEENNEQIAKRMDATAKAVGTAWEDSGLDMEFGMAVEYSRVLGSYMIGILPRLRTDGKVDIVSYAIDPRFFGVMEETVPQLQHQQAVMLTSYYPLEAIERRIMLHPDRDKIIKELASASKEGATGEQVIESISPGATQYTAAYYRGGQDDYVAKSPVTYYGFNDTYAFDDDLGDYRVITTTGNAIVWDRPIERVGIPACLPFVKVCPEEHPSYFFGISLVSDLRNLQNWYSDRMEDMDTLIQKILDPPTAGMGFGSSYEEKLGVLSKAGGKFSFPGTNASINQFTPTMPDSVFEYMGNIDSILMDQSNMRPSMFGRQEPGVRTEGMAASMLRVAGAEMRLMGLKVEKSAQACAQILFKYLRRYSDERLIDEDGVPFYMAEFPDDARVRVDGHSSSPIFVEDNAQLAMGLMRSGALTQETLVRMLHPVLEGKILADLKKIQFAKLVAQEQLKLQQEEKRSGKASTGV